MVVREQYISINLNKVQDQLALKTLCHGPSCSFSPLPRIWQQL